MYTHFLRKFVPSGYERLTFDQATLVTMGWEIINDPPYSPDLAPSDFVPVKMQQENKHFRLLANSQKVLCCFHQ
jgi:hypothetical protein